MVVPTTEQPRTLNLSKDEWQEKDDRNHGQGGDKTSIELATITMHR